MRLPERSIATYLTLAFSGLTVVLTVALAEAIGAAAGDEIKAGIGQGLTELALQTADKLDRGMAERYREVRLMSRNQVLIAEDGPPDKRRAILNDRQATYHWYAWIGLAGLDGKVRLSTQGMLEGADVSKRPWFRNALAGTYVGDVHEAVLLARLLPSPGNEPRRFVDIAFPYLDADGKPAGVVGAHLSWQWAREVQQSVMQFPQSAGGPAPGRRNMEALIVGGDSVVLLGPAGLQGQKLDTAGVRAVLSGATGHTLETWPDGRQYLVGYAKTRGYNAYPGLGWSIMVRQSVDDAYAPVRAIQRRVLWTGAALAALFSVLGLLLARRLARPMAALAASAGRVGRGEAVAVELGDGGRHGYAEVTQLAGALNALVSNLLGKTEELIELNRSLEQRVAQRTDDLERELAQVRTEQQRVQAMKNEFITTVSHELRTPMTSIRASLSLLASGVAGELPDDTKQLIDIAYASCERLVRLVNDVLDIEKMESGKMAFDFQPQALLPLAQNAIDGMQGSAAHAHVTLALEEGPGAAAAWAQADHDRLVQVVVNLLSNAVKFSPPGGRVTVTVERLADGGDWAVIRVADQGPGIPDAFRGRIFQKFAQADSTNTRQKGGTGLGLSICKSIVERHGGAIAFTTEAGRGTEFTVRLKAADPA